VASWAPYVGLFYSGAWHDISTDVYARDDIQIRRGKTDEASEPVPTSMTLTLKNRDGKYNPLNPTSPLWGLAGRNTPITIGFSPTDEDFEDTSFNFTWSMTGTGTWARSSTVAHNGTWSFKSPVLADGQSGGWHITVPTGANTVSFWVWVSVSSGSFAAVYTSEGLQWFDSGDVSAWQLVTIDVGVSTYVEIVYERNSSGASNAVWVDDLRSIDARGTGEVWKWEPQRSLGFDPDSPNGPGDAWCHVTAGGLLRRIGQASDPTHSPLYRAIAQSTTVPIQWWPLEDPEGVTAAASGLGLEQMSPVTAVRYTLPDGTALVPGGLPKFQADGGIPGADKVVGLTDGGTLSGTCPNVTNGDYSVDFVFRFKPGGNDGATSADIFSWRETGTFVHYTVNVDATSVTVFHADAIADSTLTSSGSAACAFNVYDGAPHHFRYTVAQSGGNYLNKLYIDGTLQATAANFVPPMAGTLGHPSTVELNPGEDRGEYMPVALGHVTIWPTSSPADMATPAFGTPNEETYGRLKRLAEEETWAVAQRGDQLVSPDTMGPQTIATLAEQLADIEKTEDGIIYDQRGAIAVALRTRLSQYVQTVRATLIYGVDALQPLDPVIDDQTTRNDVTAKNRDGQEYRATVDAGALAATSPFDGGVGRYPATVDVNATGGVLQLYQVAWWWANKGTVEGARHPVIVVDLDAGPSLASTVAPLDMGDRIQITGLEADTVDLRVLGVQESLGPDRRLLTLLTEPYRQYDVAVYVATGATVTSAMKRYDSRTSTTNATSTTTVTTIVVTFTDLADAWSTVNEPYDWIIEGERITVTSMAAVAGAGPYTQSATVTRSVNGVVKTHAAGEAIHMHPDQQARYAL
jgi:hypothetical protein